MAHGVTVRPIVCYVTPLLVPWTGVLVPELYLVP